MDPQKSGDVTTLNSSAVGLVRYLTLLQAPLHIARQISRQVLSKVLDILSINRTAIPVSLFPFYLDEYLRREPERSINNIGVQRKQRLRDLVGTRVLAVQGSDEGRVVAVVVELVVHGALREDSAFEFVERACDFGVGAGRDEVVFEDEAEFEVGAFD
jgi:hypothetical protein